ncbi:MAG: cyanophycin synthetase, partial [bacterium]|nr:cyanophycin synthetase [bacterium]
RMGARLRLARRDVRITWYSLKKPAARKIRKIIRIPGEHNVSNAAAAYAVGRLLRIPAKKILAAIGAYRGAWRRFDHQGRFRGAEIIADYAHPPTEIRATLQAAREKFPKRRIWCVFQPHHYERLQALFQEFSRAFADCDALILLDVYEVAGRERTQKAGGVNSERLARAVSRRGIPALYIADPGRLRPLLKRWLKPGDVLLMLGAGDIWETTKELMRAKGKG